MGLASLKSFNWFEQGFIDWPSMFYSRTYSVVRYDRTGHVNSLPNCHFVAHVRDKAICSSVIGLKFWERPTAVYFAVITVAINAINRVKSGWSITHIGIKLRKTVIPFVTYFNAAATIQMITFICRIVAASAHVAPDQKFRRFSFTMYRVALFAYFYAETSTRFSVASFQVSGTGDSSRATIANTYPLNWHPVAISVKHCQSAKSFGRQVGDPCHLWVSYTTENDT